MASVRTGIVSPDWWLRPICVNERGRRSAVSVRGTVWRDSGSGRIWIRTQPPWDNSGPWHYVNIADGDSFDDYRSPPEGDALWAIAHFRSRLRSENLTREQRSEALKFLVHFVVDLHQPLHVGRRADRGGTTTEVFLGETRTSLHRFWDTEAIRDAGLPVAHYARNVMPMATLLATGHRPSPPRQWAAESFSLRTVV